LSAKDGMVSRHLYLLMMLGAAGGLPYVVSSQLGSNSAEHTESADAAAPHAEAASTHASAAVPPAVPETPPSVAAQQASTSAHEVPASPAATVPASRPRSQNADLGQFINFAVTPAWVLNQWPRVSASLAEIDFQGYRVPLVTGTQEDDLAGSLTYYFDHQQRVARITFAGSTGDPRKLITLVTGQFGFVQDVSDDPAVVVYAVKWNKKSHSELRIRPVKIVRADDPRNRYDIELSIRRF
jgi:hypothetical protein